MLQILFLYNSVLIVTQSYLCHLSSIVFSIKVYHLLFWRISDSCAEVTKGLRCYFDKALPAMLLYKKEQKQYKEEIKGDVSPSTVYGAEHLLRLFGMSKFSTTGAVLCLRFILSYSSPVAQLEVLIRALENDIRCYLITLFDFPWSTVSQLYQYLSSLVLLFELIRCLLMEAL